MSEDNNKKWYQEDEIFNEKGQHIALWWLIHDKETDNITSDMYEFNKNANTSSNILSLNKYGYILNTNNCDLDVRIPKDYEGDIKDGSVTQAQKQQHQKKISFNNNKRISGLETCDSENYLAVTFNVENKNLLEVFSTGNLLLDGNTNSLYMHSFDQDDDIVHLKFINERCLVGTTLKKNVYLMFENEKIKIKESNICSVAKNSSEANKGVFGKDDGSLAFFSVVADNGKCLRIVENTTPPLKFSEDDKEMEFSSAHFVKFIGSNNVLVIHKTKVVFDGDEEDCVFNYQIHIYDISKKQWKLILTDEDNNCPLDMDTEENTECIFNVQFIPEPWNIALISANASAEIAMIGLNPNTKEWEHWQPNRDRDDSNDGNIILNGEEQFISGMALSFNFQSNYGALDREADIKNRIPPCPNVIVTTNCGSIIRLTLADEYLVADPGQGASERFMVLETQQLQKQKLKEDQANAPLPSTSNNSIKKEDMNEKNVDSSVKPSSIVGPSSSKDALKPNKKKNDTKSLFQSSSSFTPFSSNNATKPSSKNHGDSKQLSQPSSFTPSSNNNDNNNNNNNQSTKPRKTVNIRTKTIQPRKPSRKMNKYEAYVTKEFITYFEGGDADKIVNSDEDQKANDEAILNTIKMAKEKLIQYEEERIPMLEQRTDDMKSKILKLQTELQNIRCKAGKIETTRLYLKENKDDADSNPLPAPMLSKHEKLRENMNKIENKIRELISVVNLKQDRVSVMANNTMNRSNKKEHEISSRRRLLSLVQETLTKGVSILNQRVADLNTKRLELNKLDDSFKLMKQKEVDNGNHDSINHIDTISSKLIQLDYNKNDQSSKIEMFEDLLIQHCGNVIYDDGALNDSDLKALYQAEGGTDFLTGEEEEQRYDEKQSEYRMSLQSNPIISTPIHYHSNDMSIMDRDSNDQTMMSMSSTFKPPSSNTTTLKLGGTSNSTKEKPVSFGFTKNPSASGINITGNRNSNSINTATNKGGRGGGGFGQTNTNTTNNGFGTQGGDGFGSSNTGSGFGTNISGFNSGGGGGMDFGKSAALGVIKEESTEDKSFNALSEKKSKSRVRDENLKVDDLSGSSLFGSRSSKKKVLAVVAPGVVLALLKVVLVLLSKNLVTVRRRKKRD